MEELEAIAVLDYVRDGLDTEERLPSAAWLWRWGLGELVTSSRTDGSQSDFLPPPRMQRLWEAAIRGVRVSMTQCHVRAHVLVGVR